MSTGLTVGSVAGYPALQGVSKGQFRRDDYAFINVPTAGQTTWVWRDILGDYSEKELRGIAVVLTKPEFRLWPTVGQASPGTLPYLISLDGKVAHKRGDDPGDLDVDHIEEAKLPDGTYDCSKIKYFQWSVGKKGNNIPPRAGEASTIGIFRESGDVVFVRLSKTSSPVVHRFFRQLEARGVPHYAAIVSLGLEVVKGASANYSRVAPKFVSRIEPEAAEHFRENFTEAATASLTTKIAAIDAVPF